jgi:hypothetical protein
MPTRPGSAVGHDASVTIPEIDPDVAADTAELIRLDGLIADLAARADTARRTYHEATLAITTAQRERAVVAERLRLRAARAAKAPLTTPSVDQPQAQPTAPARTAPETSTRTVQNVLFILGGLLLGIAAIVFTAVAWATFGVGGRATILGVATGLALAVPFVALRRGLTATAETFAAIGLLLVLLDGVAVRAVNLAGVADALDPKPYYGIVFAVLSAVAAGYRVVTMGMSAKLIGPRFVALIAFQPVLPLLATRWTGNLGPGVVTTFWALLITVLALTDLAIARWVARQLAVKVIAWTLYLAALATGTGLAILAIGSSNSDPQVAAAAASLLAAAAATIAGGVLARNSAALVAAYTVAAMDTLGALAALADVVAAPYQLIAVSAAAVLIAVATTLLPRRHKLAPTVGASVLVGIIAVPLGPVLTLANLVSTLDNLGGGWHGSLEPRVPLIDLDWQVPAAQALIALALVRLLPKVFRPTAALLGAGAVAVALPPSVPLAWWTPPLVAAAVAIPAAVLAVTARTQRTAVPAACVASALAAYAALASVTRPQVTAATLAGIVALGVTVAALSKRSGKHTVGGLGLAGAVIAWPGAVACTAAAFDAAGYPVGGTTIIRLAMAAVVVGLCGAVAVRRWSPRLLGYAAGAQIGVTTVVVLAAAVAGVGDPLVINGAVGLVVVAAAAALLTGQSRIWAAVGATPLALTVLGALTPALTSVFVLPYGWVNEIWSGAPAGVGLDPGGHWFGHRADVWGLILVAVAAAAWVLVAGSTRYRAAALAAAVPAASAALVAAAAYGASWPTVPVASLAFGVAATLAVALTPAKPATFAVGTAFGLVSAGAGMAGCLATRWATLGGLAAVLATAVLAGVAGRRPLVRQVAWIVTVIVAPTATYVATRIADAPPVTTVLALLGAGAVLLLGGLLTKRPVEAQILETGGHVTAAVALLISLPTPGRAALVAALWGVVLGLRALWPGLSAAHRRTFVSVAAGAELLAWWLLLAEREVDLIEAYTLPLAAVALLAGWLALRSRPDLRSWVAYGPALAAAFGPSLAPILTTEGSPWRRLLLGVAALIVLVAGAVRRRQAPVVIAGAVLVVIAVHELVVVLPRLQTWIPLSVAGFVLVVLAITYERRRRELALLRDSLTRMS